MTEKEKKWLAEYYQCWNATEAARRAGYKYPNKQGPEKKEKFSNEIKSHLEAVQMSADEALIRMAAIARGDISDYLEFKEGIKTPYLNLEKAYRDGKFGIVKKFKYDNNGRPEIELYPADVALRDILKIHGLFKERIEVSWKDKIPDGYEADEVKRQFVGLMRYAAKHPAD